MSLLSPWLTKISFSNYLLDVVPYLLLLIDVITTITIIDNISNTNISTTSGANSELHIAMNNFGKLC